MNEPLHNVDPREVANFSEMAPLWWQAEGEFKALHEINPVRLSYVARAGIAGRQVLDVGCGGGLLAESMAAQGAVVTGIDMVPEALEVARAHAAENGLSIDYRQSTAEEWGRAHSGRYDVVTCMELVEHVPDPAGLVKACARLVRPGGDIFFATVNRTLLSRLLVIIVAEYVMGIVRKGTHTYQRFVKPEELGRWGKRAGLTVLDISGLRYIPLIKYARLCNSTQMNYLIHFRK